MQQDDNAYTLNTFTSRNYLRLLFTCANTATLKNDWPPCNWNSKIQFNMMRMHSDTTDVKI